MGFSVALSNNIPFPWGIAFRFDATRKHSLVVRCRKLHSLMTQGFIWRFSDTGLNDKK